MWCIGALRQDSFDVFSLQIGYRNITKSKGLSLDDGRPQERSSEERPKPIAHHPIH